ncbi:MAG: PIN domain-containing protein [Chloroflexota bacterium]|nr:PIN domain-containing protein [Chloroflexota bacterium]
MKYSLDPETVCCFVDTNVLLQYQTFDQVDWRQVVRAQHVTLILAPIVLAELDRHKDSMANQRLHDRAREIMPRLAPLLEQALATGEPAYVREGVYIVGIPEEPDVDWSAARLDPNTNDDRLIAAMIDVHTSWHIESLVLVSADFTPRFKAQAKKLPAIDPKGLIQELHDMQRAAAKTAQKPALEASPAAPPKLVFGFTEDVEKRGFVHRPFNLPQKPRPEDYVAITKEFVDGAVAGLTEDMEERIQKARSQGVPELALNAYAQDYKKYLREMGPALMMQDAQQYGPSFELAFSLQNMGHVTAQDVEIRVEFPIGSFVVATSRASNQYSNTIERPEEPKPLWEKKEVRRDAAFSFAGSMDLYVPSLEIPTIPVPRHARSDGLYHGEDHERHIITYEYEKIRPGAALDLEHVIVYVSPATRGGFMIAYTISADNMQKADAGRLNVVALGAD